MLRKIGLLVVVFMMSTGISFGAVLPDQAAAKDLAGKVVAKFVAGEVDASFQMLKEYTVIGSSDYDSFVSKTKSQMESANQQLGIPLGSEFIDQKEIGGMLLRLRYVEKYSKTPVVWTFFFYKQADGWTLNAFYWNGDFMELFQVN